MEKYVSEIRISSEDQNFSFEIFISIKNSIIEIVSENRLINSYGKKFNVKDIWRDNNGVVVLAEYFYDNLEDIEEFTIADKMNLLKIINALKNKYPKTIFTPYRGMI